MKVDLYSILKKEKDYYSIISEDLLKMISKFATIKDKIIFNKTITNAQNAGALKAQESYTKVYEPYLKKGYNIILHPKGKLMDSFEFAKLLEDKQNVQFFVGGAYGFDEKFLKMCDKKISLSHLTLSHKIAKIVLLEQIFRGFSILNKHPYHK